MEKKFKEKIHEMLCCKECRVLKSIEVFNSMELAIELVFSCDFG